MLYIYVHHLIFKETAYSLKEELRKNNYEVEITNNFKREDSNSDLYIIFGGHDLIEKFPNRSLPKEQDVPDKAELMSSD